MMKTYMLWIPGRVIGTWNSIPEARQGVKMYLEKADSIRGLKLTVYYKDYQVGSTVDYTLSEQEIVDALKE